MKYRKKPIVIEATQWNGFADGPHDLGIEPYRRDSEDGWIGTLEGGHIVTPGDYIIIGIAGERYPCKSHIFDATYDAVGS